MVPSFFLGGTVPSQILTLNCNSFNPDRIYNFSEYQLPVEQVSI